MKRPEQQLHKDVVAQLRDRSSKGLVWWHTPNGARYGGANPAMHGAIMKRLGVRAGVSDFVFVHKGKFYALELKAIGGKPPTEQQIEFIQDVNNAGGFATCAVGLNEAIGCLETWGLLKGGAA